MNKKNELAQKKCTPCAGGVPPMKGDLLSRYYEIIGKEWKVQEEHHLEKEYSFKNFKEALAFTVLIGEIAEEQGHHPDILLRWGKVKVILWTHKIEGLSEADFIMAAKCDRCFEEGKKQ